MKTEIQERNDRKINLLNSTIDLPEKYDRSKKKKVDILERVDNLFDKIQENRDKEIEMESEFPIIDNKQRRQFQYSKYRTEVLNNICNKDNLTLTKVLSSMPLYKQEKIYEIKKQGIKEFVEKKFNKTRTRAAIKVLPQIKKRESSLLEQRYLGDLKNQGLHSLMSSDDECQVSPGLRIRSPDETLTYLRDNFGIVVRPPEKSKLRTRKELEQEERLMEKERRKIYNIKDKLDLYYTTLEGPITSRRRIDEPLNLLNNSSVFGDGKSGDLSPMVDKEMRNSIFNRNQYYSDHYSNIKIGVGKEKSMAIMHRSIENINE